MITEKERIEWSIENVDIHKDELYYIKEQIKKLENEYKKIERKMMIEQFKIVSYVMKELS